MQPAELVNLAKRIQTYNCEFQTVEVKAAHMGCPTKLFDTISSFSNQDDGGVIVFGLDEKQAFAAVGVYDVQDLQHNVVEQCKQMEPSVRPLFTVTDMDGNIIVSAEIPGVDIADRPVFYRGVGRLKGSYIRSGESDEPMSEYEIYSYDAFRRRIRDDIRVVENGKVSLFDEALLQKYLAAVKMDRSNAAQNISDGEILELMGVTINGTPTLSGVLAFSKYPQAYFPQLCIIAVSVPGTEMGDTGADGERFIDNQRITGTITDLLDGAVDFVRRNSRVKTIIDDDGKRADKAEYPIKAVREAILNALVHRDYSIHTENVPIRITMYRDRMETINGGGLYGRVSIDSLGQVHPETRNPALANIIELLGVTENRYSGIPTIRKEMAAAGLPAPVFSVRRGEFTVVFKNNLQQVNEAKAPTKGIDLLTFCQTPRSREELIEYAGFTRYHVMNNLVKPLLADGKLQMTIPDKPKSKNQKYYTVK